VRLNVERRHLTAAQKRQLIEAELRCNPARTDRALGKLVRADHKTVGAVRLRLVSSGEIPQSPAVGRNGKTYRNPVVGAETPAQAHAAARVLRELGGDAPGGPASLRTLRTRVMERERAGYAAGPAARLPARVRIDHADFRAWKGAKTNSVDLILSDPPWLPEYAHLREPFARFAARTLRPGGLLLAYVGQYDLPGWLAALGRHLTYQWTFAAVNDSGGALMSVMKARRIHTGWRPLVLFSKGAGRLPGLVKDVVYSDRREKEMHGWSQPLGESEYFVSALCPRGGTVCDVFVGSGTVPAAVARAGGGLRFVGCDVDEESVRVARRRVANVLPAAGVGRAGTAVRATCP
jgi:SAM-dependent methyltransferase